MNIKKKKKKKKEGGANKYENTYHVVKSSSS